MKSISFLFKAAPRVLPSLIENENAALHPSQISASNATAVGTVTIAESPRSYVTMRT